MPDQEFGIDEVAELYLDQLHAKEEPDRIAIVEAFPELGDELGKRLRLMDLLYNAGKHEKNI